MGWDGMGWLSLEGAIYRAPTVLRNHRNICERCHVTPFLNWGQISSLSFRRPPNYLEELLQTFAEGKLQRTLNPTMLLVLQHCGQLFRNIQCDLPLCVLWETDKLSNWFLYKIGGRINYIPNSWENGLRVRNMWCDTLKLVSFHTVLIIRNFHQKPCCPSIFFYTFTW